MDWGLDGMINWLPGDWEPPALSIFFCCTDGLPWTVPFNLSRYMHGLDKHHHRWEGAASFPWAFIKPLPLQNLLRQSSLLTLNSRNRTSCFLLSLLLGIGAGHISTGPRKCLPKMVWVWLKLWWHPLARLPAHDPWDASMMPRPSCGAGKIGTRLPIHG